MNLQKIFEYALQREKEGYQFFKSNADKAGHAADQRHHLPYQSWVILAFADTNLGQNEIARCCLGDRGARKEGAWPV